MFQQCETNQPKPTAKNGWFQLWRLQLFLRNKAHRSSSTISDRIMRAYNEGNSKELQGLYKVIDRVIICLFFVASYI